MYGWLPYIVKLNWCSSQWLTTKQNKNSGNEQTGYMIYLLPFHFHASSNQNTDTGRNREADV